LEQFEYQCNWESLSKDSTINALPPYHTSGWNVFITPLLHKGHIGMVENLMPNEFYIFEENKTTLFMALPTMLTMMQKTAMFQNKVNLRYIISEEKWLVLN
jgi:fatty-acyl-CoA synthase